MPTITNRNETIYLALLWNHWHDVSVGEREGMDQWYSLISTTQWQPNGLPNFEPLKETGRSHGGTHILSPITCSQRLNWVVTGYFFFLFSHLFVRQRFWFDNINKDIERQVKIMISLWFNPVFLSQVWPTMCLAISTREADGSKLSNFKVMCNLGCCNDKTA